MFFRCWRRFPDDSSLEGIGSQIIRAEEVRKISHFFLSELILHYESSTLWNNGITLYFLLLQNRPRNGWRRCLDHRYFIHQLLLFRFVSKRSSRLIFDLWSQVSVTSSALLRLSLTSVSSLPSECSSITSCKSVCALNSLLFVSCSTGTMIHNNLLWLCFLHLKYLIPLFFQITFFAAVLTYSGRREEEGGLASCCYKKTVRNRNWNSRIYPFF